MSDDVDMLTFYVDETGDTGDPSKKGSSACYGLGIVVVRDDLWPAAFDALLDMRRDIRKSSGVPMRAELKANYLIRGHGPLKSLSLSPSQRGYIYRKHLMTLDAAKVRAYSVVVDKTSPTLGTTDYLDLAWGTFLQRVERTCKYEDETAIIIHDEGEDAAVRGLVRKARRFLTAGKAFGSGSFVGAARTVIDDPIPRDSRQSYFLQMADLVAYAGWRSYMAPSKSVAAVAPGSMWSHIGAATFAAVNGLKPVGEPGVVIRK